MTKTEIIEKVAENAGADKKTAAAIINAFLNEIKGAVKGGGVVTLKDFGAFKLVNRKERLGRNPRTGEEITIPAHKSAYFSAAKAFQNLVKGN